MLLIPVNRKLNDPFYRYKMPSVEVTVESNKTVIKNILNISKSIYRSPNLILKYLSYKLGCKDLQANQKYFLQGHFTNKQIQSYIYDFIDEYVLCKKCNNPETEFVIDGEKISRRCLSCGGFLTQSESKFNKTILKTNEGEFNDKNYKKLSLVGLINEHQDNQKVLLEFFKNNKLSIDDVFNELIKSKDLIYFKGIFDQISDKNRILEEVEKMIEKFDKCQFTRKYLKVLVEIFNEEFVRNYFESKSNKKRHPLIKKEVKLFFN
ncbi:IF5 [Hepatospora eriocheir]|uniref:IF5 n=1 Tax=Hepatospora eriocheir TaxID=1081669 RepID=A0A1X0QAB8_9MICR|nr:IF5 [Hepatospora eriocheir]